MAGRSPQPHSTGRSCWQPTGSQVAHATNPGTHPVTYLLNLPVPGVPGKKDQARGPQGEGSGSLARCSRELRPGSPARATLASGNSFDRVWLSPVVLEFSNAPYDWLPRPSHPAPSPDWPRGVPVILPTAPLGGAGWGGCHLATCVVPSLNPLPRSPGGELGAEPQPEALKAPPPPLPAAPQSGPALPRTGCRGGKATAQS